MGCFDVVCALTNTPIKSGEKCHLVLLRKDVSWDTLTWIMSHEGKLCVEHIFHGEYNDYGTVEDCENLTDAGLKLLQDFDEDRDRKHFFVCDMAYQWAQERFKNYIPYDVRQEDMYQAALTTPSPFKMREERRQELITIGRLILAFSHACKHPLSGLGLYHQYDGTEIERIEENLKLCQQRLEYLKAERLKNAEEYGGDMSVYAEDDEHGGKL